MLCTYGWEHIYSPYGNIPFQDEGFFIREETAAYHPRNPEDNPLYGIVADNLETYLAMQSAKDRTVPFFVEHEFRAFMDCGVLAHGFLRVHCDLCGKDRVVAFSCKGRAVCSSCCGRRMADTAAHLVDRVLPMVPVRQWVLSLPFALRYRLAYDSCLVRDVLHIFIKTIFSLMRRRARQYFGIKKAQCGAVTFVQRFGGAINLNIHFHTLVLDGVYYEDPEKGICFRRLPALTDVEVKQILEAIVKKILHLLERRGLGPQADPEEADPLRVEQPLLAELYSASVQGRVTEGENAGAFLRTAGMQEEEGAKGKKPGRCCANLSGFSLHANVCIPAKARRQLENLCRYVARPAVAMERLSKLPDGRILYHLRHRWHNGATDVIFDPLDLIGKLAALVPPPRFNMVRYHGTLAPSAKWRKLITPQGKDFVESAAGSHCGRTSKIGNRDQEKTDESAPKAVRPRNYNWAELMKRVFGFDVLQCNGCGGRMRILCAVNPPEAIRKILDCLGLPSRPPPISSAVLAAPFSD